jgi:hypothetical protein
VTRRIWLRVAALVLAAVGVVIALTVYFSSEKTPPCFVSLIADWRAPTDRDTHRYVVAFPDHAACFFAPADRNELVAQLRVPSARTSSSAAPLQDDVALRTAAGPVTVDLRRGRARRGGLVPFASTTLTVPDVRRGVMYVTQRALLGFRVIDMRDGATRFVVGVRGRGRPDAPSHGLCLAPNRPQLWVLDARNSRVSLYDVRDVPAQPPRHVRNVRIEEVHGLGSLLCSADGRFVYVGGSGDVIDTGTRSVTTHLEALQHTNVLLEVTWADGRPFFPGYPR